MAQDFHTPSPPPVQSASQKAPWKNFLVLVLALMLLASCVTVLVRSFSPPQTLSSSEVEATQEAASRNDATKLAAIGTAASISLATDTANTALAQDKQTAQVVSTNPDPYGASGKLIVYDPLTDAKSGSSSDIDYGLPDDLAGSGCGFQNGGYYVKTDNRCSFGLYDLSNFVLDVQLAIASGGTGGIYFWSDTGYLNYHLLFDDKGDYELWGTFLTTSPFGTPITIEGTDFGVVYEKVASGRSAAFHVGSHQSNRIGLVVRGSTFTWYANSVQAGSFTESKYSPHSLPSFVFSHPPSPGGDSGLISSGSSETVFHDLRIWQL